MTCSYNPEWEDFRGLVRQNADAEHSNARFDESVYAHADFLVGKNFHSFMAFKKSKSNEFFFDCSRETIVGEICYYGMMQAFAVQFRYMGMKGLFAELMMGGGSSPG